MNPSLITRSNAFLHQPAVITAVNFALLMVIYMLSRWVFYFFNLSSFQDVTFTDMLSISRGGLRFDLSALCYLNLPYFVMQLVPLKRRHSVGYQRAAKWLFVIVNSLGLIANAADIVYYEFGGRRSTATIFAEYGGESNLGTILLNSLTAYWPVWLFGIATILAIIFLYYNPVTDSQIHDSRIHDSRIHDSQIHDSQSHRNQGNSYFSLFSFHFSLKSFSFHSYYPLHTFVFIIALILAIGGARGGLGLKMHPMRQDSATIYCRKPQHAALVLNTPFTIITTLHKSGYTDPHFFPAEQLDSIFNPIHTLSPPRGEPERGCPNIVVFLLESFSMEYTGFYNKDLDGGNYEGYTPFLDSLVSQSYSFRYSFANGTRSVDCMPAVFAGVPRYINPYCYYLYANNTLQALPQMLRDEGYTTAFFHGAPNTTLGFRAFTNAIGFEHYFGLDEYPTPDDFDGTWAIFDEPYLQYFAHQCDTIAAQGAPFLATVFTASSHEPFRIPDQHKDRFTRGTIPMHNAISYADYALRRYFQQVQDKPWFRNTIFVITADHTGVPCRQDYNNEMGRFLIPIFFYTPGGQLPVCCDTTRLMQQIDITPTLLSLIGYNKPYFSFGKDVLDTSPDYVNYVFNDRNGLSMYYLDSLMIEYNDNRLEGIYDFRRDITLSNNLISRQQQFQQLPFMQQQIEAIIQQYVNRMKANTLHY